MSVLGDERSGSGPDLFRGGCFIPGGGPSSVARSARGAGANARAQLCPSRRYFDAADYVYFFNTIHYLVTKLRSTWRMGTLPYGLPDPWFPCAPPLVEVPGLSLECLG